MTEESRTDMINKRHPEMLRDPDIGAPGEPRPLTARRTIAVVVAALSLGALLNAGDLLATAQRQPYGWVRTAALAVAEPLDRASGVLLLDVPRQAIDLALGRGEPGDRPAQAAEPTSAPTDASGPLPTTTPTSAPEPSPSPTPTPTKLVISEERPLRLYIGGDSMVEIQFGIALEDLADDTGMIEVLAIDYDRGSGLSRPDFIDWPARLAQVSADLTPDAMVVYFGGNDAQPLKIDGAVYEPEAPEWQAEYRGRVAALMDQLSDAGHHVYWMGLPIPRSEKMVTRFGILNAIYEEEAATRDAITFVPMWDVFADTNGVYAEYLPNQNGDVVDMRLNDGIHLTTAGAYRAARPTITRILEDFDIG